MILNYFVYFYLVFELRCYVFFCYLMFFYFFLLLVLICKYFCLLVIEIVFEEIFKYFFYSFSLILIFFNDVFVDFCDKNDKYYCVDCYNDFCC